MNGSLKKNKNVDHPNYTLIGIIIMALGLVLGNPFLFMTAMVFLILGEVEFTPVKQKK